MTYFFMAITAITSYMAFNDSSLFQKFQFNAYRIVRQKEYYRLLSHGFVHADWMHLIVNMWVLFMVGRNVESYFDYFERSGIIHHSGIWFSLLYLSSIVAASLTTLWKHKDHPWYNSVGASGGVSAVLFCYIFLSPWSTFYFYFLIPLPGIVLGVLYLFYSQYMGKKNIDNVNHDAHFVGAVFGFLFPLLISYHLIFNFLEMLINPTFH